MSLRVTAQAEPLPGYVLVERLGAGGFGEVWKAMAPGGIAKAIKIIHGSLHCADEACFALQELKALSRVKQVRHPYLLALDRFDIVEGRLLIVMELADCNLWDRFVQCREAGLPGIPRHELLTYMLETAEVLDLFNDQFQLQHLDIKPQNLFLLHNHVKVADFGQVKDLQGLVAAVTGGITPVYAAPETFDGTITRYCDQYSLACVYQELLTGRRPFDGTTPAQLLRQHLFQSPQLDALPPSDRPIVARALAKKPEDRWPTVTAFVQHLIGSTPSGIVRFPALRRLTETTSVRLDTELPTPVLDERDTPTETSAGSSALPLPPALVIGIGGAALPILQRLRWEWLQLAEGPIPEHSPPPLELLFVDTDAQTVAWAREGYPPEGRAALPEEDIVHTPLQRMAYYMRPRPSGRLITEGWFDPGLLHVLPRQPQTEGIRMLGRLAFCDHHRLILQRIESALRSLATMTSTTPLPAGGTSRLMVIIVAGLGGGTGSGMFLDMAYAVRSRLQQLDLPQVSVQALLLLPPSTPHAAPMHQLLVNSHAALRELIHYSYPDTIYTVDYEELHGQIQTRLPPFDRCYLLLQTPDELEVIPRRDSAVFRWRYRRDTPQTGSRVLSRPTSRDQPLTPTPLPRRLALSPSEHQAAEWLRLQLLTPVGPRLRAVLPQNHSPTHLPISVASFGHWRWPRQELLHRMAVTWTQHCLLQWTELPGPEPSPQLLTLAHHLWAELKLTPTQLREELEHAATAALGRPPTQLWNELIAPHLPRSWFGRLPQGTRLEETIQQLLLLLGPPRKANAPSVGVIEPHLNAVVEQRLHTVRKHLLKNLNQWMCDPRLFLGGCEMLLWQWLAVAERFWNRYSHEAQTYAEQAGTHYEVLMNALHAGRGLRRPSNSELRDALSGFPDAQYATLCCRALIRFYQQLRDLLNHHFQELRHCREQLRTLAENQTKNLPPRRCPPNWLLPPDCHDLQTLADHLLRSLPTTERQRIQTEALSTILTQHKTSWLSLLAEERGRHECWRQLLHALTLLLPPCLNQLDFFHVLQQRCPTSADLQQMLRAMFANAQTPLPLAFPRPNCELWLFAGPNRTSEPNLRELAFHTLPIEGLLVADLNDEWLVYRECFAFDPKQFPHLGSESAQLYQHWLENCETSPHSRLDVNEWKA
jgi:serine/threonine protein kinase